MKHSILPAMLAVALMGQGCMSPALAPSPAPAQPAEPPAAAQPVTTEPAPAPAPTTPEPASAPVKTTTPTPAPAPKTGTTVKPKTVTVEIRDNAFSPQIIAINAGDTVIWKNAGQSNHTVHNITGVLWDSGNLVPGATFSRKFTATGRYEYGCGVHASMKGTVIVGEVQASQ